jgi:alpha-beta hydrolase superfamily lysophospholipase
MIKNSQKFSIKFNSVKSFVLVILVCYICGFAGALAPQAAECGPRLISATQIASRNIEDVKAFFIKNKISVDLLNKTINPVQNSSQTQVSKIIYYRLDYHSFDHKGFPVISSGLLALPDLSALPTGAASRALKLVSYQHGTIFNDRDAPSQLDSCTEAEAVASVFVLNGFAAAMADYIGLGRRAGFHPYFHAESSAADCDNFLKAVKEFLAWRGLYPAGGRVYIAGFSQGGHAALALQRRLESPGASESGLLPAATAVIGGACDPELVLRSWLIKPNALSSAVMGRILESYRIIYSIGGDEPRQTIFRPPYDKILNDIAESGNTIEKTMKLPARLKELLTDDFITAINAREDIYIKKLNENEVYKNWRAIAPVNFYHGGSDSIIPFTLSKVACRRMKANGAKAGLINAGASADHADSIIPSCLMARDWFASFNFDDNKVK